MAGIKFEISKEQWIELAGKTERLLKWLEEQWKNELEGGLTAEKMAGMNADQITLVAYLIFRREMLDGGLVELIYNGYGPFIFLNPFAKALRKWGLKDFGKFVYEGRGLYEAHRGEIEGKDLEEADFMALYEQHSEMDDLDDEFVETEPLVSAEIATFVVQNHERFAIFVK